MNFVYARSVQVGLNCVHAQVKEHVEREWKANITLFVSDGGGYVVGVL